MVKPLSFKGEKRPKKRKRTVDAAEKSCESDITEHDPCLSKNGDPATEGDDSWVMAEIAGDVIGPIVVVLPSEPPTCIACDANGKVFASALENIIDGDPSTAEPHDVRQVWIANRLTGTDNFSFKSCHSKYVVIFYIAW
jgi:protein FRG1